jgi:hypothetical protein
MPKPSEEILAWIATLTPANELAVRMAICLNNPWCQDDEPWQSRIAELQAKFFKSSGDRDRYERRAAEMARDMDAAVREMKEQFTAPAPTEPPLR